MSNYVLDLNGPTQSRAIKDLLQSLFISELINPSERLWIGFAWVTDINLINNSARNFCSIQPDWPASEIQVSKVLESLLVRGSELRLILRETKHNQSFIRKIKKLKQEYGNQIKWVSLKKFHEKILLGDRFFLHGSMNLTKSGLTENNEHIVLRTDKDTIAKQSLQLEQQWGEKLV